VFSIIRSMPCDYNHSHTPTNVHDIYKITRSQYAVYKISCMFQRLISILWEILTQRNIKSVHRIHI